MQDGRLKLGRKLSSPAELLLQACDYGSPQRCAQAPLRVTPVHVTSTPFSFPFPFLGPTPRIKGCSWDILDVL